MQRPQRKAIAAPPRRTRESLGADSNHAREPRRCLSLLALRRKGLAQCPLCGGAALCRAGLPRGWWGVRRGDPRSGGGADSRPRVNIGPLQPDCWRAARASARAEGREASHPDHGFGTTPFRGGQLRGARHVPAANHNGRRALGPAAVIEPSVVLVIGGTTRSGCRSCCRSCRWWTSRSRCCRRRGRRCGRRRRGPCPT